MLFGLHAEKITNRCPPASPELAMAGRLREPSTTSLPGHWKKLTTQVVRFTVHGSRLPCLNIFKPFNLHRSLTLNLGTLNLSSYDVISCPQTKNFSSGCQQISNSKREAGKGL